MTAVLTLPTQAPPVNPLPERLNEFLNAVITEPSASRYDAQQGIDEEDLRAGDTAGIWAIATSAVGEGFADDLTELGELADQLGSRCTSWRNLLTVQSMVQYAITRWGTEEQRTQWLPQLASGDARGCFCLTEPGGGGATATVTATAERFRDGWILNGVKKWITGATIGTVLLVMARYEGSVISLLVPRQTPGVEIAPINGMLGARASFLGEITLKDVRLPSSALLGPDSMGSGAVMVTALDIGRYTVARGSCGMQDRCLDEIAREIAQRAVKGTPEQQTATLGRLTTELDASRMLCERAARMHSAHHPQAMLAMWQAKYHASSRAATAAREAVQAAGAEGCLNSSPSARFYRDAKTLEIIEGTAEMHHKIVGRQALAARKLP